MQDPNPAVQSLAKPPAGEHAKTRTQDHAEETKGGADEETGHPRRAVRPHHQQHALHTGCKCRSV